MGKPQITEGQKPLLFWIKAAFIGASLPLLLSHQSWAKDCTKTEIDSNIEQFKDAKKVKAALDAVVKCGEEARAPLKLALKEDEAAIRANAASALGKMGATAQDAVPILVDTLEDSDETVRTEALSALIQIGKEVIKQDIPWSEFITAIEELEALKKSLEEALAHLEKDKKNWTSKKKEIKELRNLASIELPDKVSDLTDKMLYRVQLWVKKNPWVGLPAGYLIVNLGIFIVRPTFLLKLDEWLRHVTFRNTGFTLPLPLFLKYNPRVLDAWVAQRIKMAREEFFGKEGRTTFKEREIHVSQPVILNEEEPEEFKAERYLGKSLTNLK